MEINKDKLYNFLLPTLELLIDTTYNNIKTINDLKNIEVDYTIKVKGKIDLKTLDGIINNIISGEIIIDG